MCPTSCAASCLTRASAIADGGGGTGGAGTVSNKRRLLEAGSNEIEQGYVLKDGGVRDGLEWVDAKPGGWCRSSWLDNRLIR